MLTCELSEPWDTVHSWLLELNIKGASFELVEFDTTTRLYAYLGLKEAFLATPK